VAIADEAELAREQCRVWSWLEARRDEGELSTEEFGRAVEGLREPDELSGFVISRAIPDAFGPVAALKDEQRNQELDWIETRLRRTFMDRYGGRHVVMNRFVVLHVTHELALTLDAARKRASFGSRIWVQPARFTLVELEYAMLRLKRDQIPEVTGLHLDIEHNTLVVSVMGDAAAWQERLRAVYGAMITAEETIIK
jgi:hypothetical protein